MHFFLRDEPVNDHYDIVLKACGGKKKRLDISDEICYFRRNLSKTFPLDSSALPAIL
jgi:hypothetical protein